LPHYAARDVFGGISGVIRDDAHNTTIARITQRLHA
jgi:hypothetical protein